MQKEKPCNKKTKMVNNVFYFQINQSKLTTCLHQQLFCHLVLQHDHNAMLHNLHH